jgi:phosphoserine phosphatase
MDSTIIENESLDDLADLAGLKPQVEAITEKAMRGEIDFGIALKERVRLLKGQPETILDRFLSERIKITDGALGLIKTMKIQGVTTALVSGGFSHITEHVAKRVGFDINLGNHLLIRDKMISGEISTPILNAQSKEEVLHSITNNQNLKMHQTIAVGDGANDIPMLQSAGTGVAFRAKPIVQASVPFRIQYCDLTALLYIQGFHDNEITK